MKKTLIEITLSACALLGLAGVAHAATPYSNSIKYFDEAGRVVGQQILYCNNFSRHGGNIHTAYKIVESIACGSAPPADVIVPGTQIIGYTLPGSLTISQACGPAQCIDAGMQPDMLAGVTWTWYTGWQ